ncbi:MAG: hypothetical protein H0V91_02875 [Flavisolibacter sp.]|jgi:hypothetical protein|nr:hypothetical protein [Flavisolibacter sp.]
MRKFLLLLLLNVYVAAEAQVIENGKNIIGGSIGFGYNANSADTILGSLPSFTSKSGYFNFSPSLGKAIKNNLVLGGRIITGFSASESLGNNREKIGKSNNYNIGAGVFIERFFALSNKFSISASAPLQFNHSRQVSKTYSANNWSSTSTLRFNGVGLSVFPSINYAIKNKWLVQIFTEDFISIGYNRYRLTNEGTMITPHTQTGSNFGVHSTINQNRFLGNLHFAFRYIF